MVQQEYEVCSNIIAVNVAVQCLYSLGDLAICQLLTTQTTVPQGRQHSTTTSRLLTVSSLWLAVRVSESVHEKRNGSNEIKQTTKVKMAHIFSFFINPSNTQIFSQQRGHLKLDITKPSSVVRESCVKMVMLMLLYHNNGLYSHSPRSSGFPSRLSNTDYCYPEVALDFSELENSVIIYYYPSF